MMKNEEEEKIQDDQKIENLTFVVISDTHGKHDKVIVPNGDVLIHAGDFTSSGTPREVQEFIEFLKKQPHKYKIVIAGNHQVTFDEEFYSMFQQVYHKGRNYDTRDLQKNLMAESVYLENETFQLFGYQFFGSPIVPKYYDWGFMKDVKELEKFWKDVPECDILITHGPPQGVCDLTRDNQRAGCPSLIKEVINRIKPIVHIFGHIHEGYGVIAKNQTLFINAAICTANYKPTNSPIVFTLPVQTKTMSKLDAFKLLQLN